MINTLRSAAHLQRELGDEGFGALINSDNTNAVRQFVQRLMLPKQLTIGGRTYQIVTNFLLDNEVPYWDSFEGHKTPQTKTILTESELIARAVKIGASLGEDDGIHILDHQEEIPSHLQGKIDFLLTDSGGSITHIYHRSGEWICEQNWVFLRRDSDRGTHVLLRRMK